MLDAAAGLPSTVELRALQGGFYTTGSFNTPGWESGLGHTLGGVEIILWYHHFLVAAGLMKENQISVLITRLMMHLEAAGPDGKLVDLSRNPGYL